MNETIIREIAQQIVKEQFLLNWHYYVIFLCVSFLIAVGSAYLTSYMRERGKNFASKADFTDLMIQLKETTKTAEEVKTSISHADWMTKEWKTLRRIKLEELLESVYSTRLWIDKEQNERFFGTGSNTEKSPIYKVTLISRLYFPELKLEMLALSLLFSEYMSWTIQNQAKLHAAKGDSAQSAAVWDSLQSEIKVFHDRLLNSITAFEEKTPIVMKEIVGV